MIRYITHFYAFYNFLTVHARVLQFHLWFPYGKIADLYFFLVRVMSLSSVMSLLINKMVILLARYLKTYLS